MSCALDVADQGPASREEIGAALGFSREWIRRIVLSALETLAAAHPELRDHLLEREAFHAQSLGEQIAAIAPGRGVARLLAPVPAEAEDLEGWANEASAYVRAGASVRRAWELANAERVTMSMLPQWVSRKCSACGEWWNVREDLADKAFVCRLCEEDEAEPKEETKMAKDKDTEPKANGSAKPDERKLVAEYHEPLPCKILSVDVEEKANALAVVLGEEAQLKDRKRSVLAEFRQKQNYYDERKAELGEAVRTKTERRSTKIQEWLLPTNEIEIIRTDTAEVIRKRTADAQDLQEDMWTDGPKGAKPKKGRKPKGDEKPAPDLGLT